MRKCTSFPSLVVLKHIHMSSMFPFLLLPLPCLPFSFSFPPPSFSSSSYFPPWRMAAVHRWMIWAAGVVFSYCQVVDSLDSGCHRSSLVFWSRLRASAQCQRSWMELCAIIGSHSLSTSHKLEHTHTHTNVGRPSLVCGPVFSFFFFYIFLFLPVWLSLTPSLSASPSLRKAICFKTRAKYYHIYIFLFQEGSEVGVCGVDLTFLFPFFSLQWKALRLRLGSVWNFKPFSCLFVLWFCRALCLHRECNIWIR